MAYCKVTLLGNADSGLLGKADSGLMVQECKPSKPVCLPCLNF